MSYKTIMYDILDVELKIGDLVAVANDGHVVFAAVREIMLDDAGIETIEGKQYRLPKTRNFMIVNKYKDEYIMEKIKL